MARRVQYQVQTRPVLPPTTTTWGWFEPLSEPTRRPFQAWQSPDLTLQPIAPPPVPPMSNWFAPLSDPVRVPLRNNNLFDIAEPIPSAIPPPTAWFGPLSEPVRIPLRNNLYDEVQPASPFDHDFAPRESWFSPLSEPVRQSLRNNNLFDIAEPIPSAIPPPTAWFSPLSEPVRQLRRNTLYDEAQPVPQQYDFAPLDSWFSRLSDPVRQPQRNTLYDEAQPVPQQYDFAPLDSWFAPWRDPVRVKNLVLFDIAEPVTQPAAAVPPISWLSLLAEPIRRLAQHQHTDQAEPIPQIAPQVPSADSWFKPLSEPTLRKPFVQDISVLALQVVPFALGMGWFAPYSNPVWVPRKVTHVSISGFQANANPDNPTADKWNQAWSEPVRTQPRTAFFDFFTAPPALVVNASQLGWLVTNWVDPVRLRLPTAVAIADPLTVSVASPPDRWFTPLSEPVRVPLRNNLFDIAQPIPQFTIPAPSMDSWFRLLSDPVRLPLRNTLYHDAILAPPQIAAPPPSMDSWFRLLSEPVRVPLRDTLTHEVFGPILRVTPPVVSIGWFNDLSEPVRVPLRTPYFETETLSNLSYIAPVTVLVARAPTYQPYRPTPPDIYSWTYFNPLLALQFVPTPFNWTVRSPQPIDQFWVGPRPPPPPLPVTVGQWFHGWDPPVWDKPRASHFSPSAGPPVVVPLPNVVARLQMTERKDVWSMTFLEAVTPYTARVGVIELPTPSGSVGVIEGPHS